LIRGSRIAAQELLHSHRHAAVAEHEDEVEVVRHQAVAQAGPVMACRDAGEAPEERDPVEVVVVDRLLTTPASAYVVDAARKFLASSSRHS
jgi:riboflavin biosynthesis pyrimidine reductase